MFFYFSFVKMIFSILQASRDCVIRFVQKCKQKKDNNKKTI